MKVECKLHPARHTQLGPSIAPPPQTYSPERAGLMMSMQAAKRTTEPNPAQIASTESTAFKTITAAELRLLE